MERSTERVGQRGRTDDAFAHAYPELCRLARARLRDGGREGAAMQTVTLVHECYLRLADSATLPIEERRAFFAYASRTMRSIIIDTLRERQAQRRGGDLAQVTLDTVVAEGLPSGEDEVLQIHETLKALEAVDARLARVVEMRYFGGYSEAEIADALQVTDRTVRRDWERARLLLMDALRH